ncbi:alpha/beta hydrolase-fold protein [Puniceicoccaceae bacterium K14]|nr:alpha/beta hydrolase-fold protein [Puniceicoccaceae bacterium K14]
MNAISSLIFCVSLVFVANTVKAGEPLSAYLQSLGNPKYHRMTAEERDQLYHIFVRLPDDYTESKSYPTIYLLDGGITFPLLAAYYQYLSLGEEVPDCIIVGISYGTLDWQKGNNRSFDFTTQSSEANHWGGAPVFLSFLNKELLPFIEENYSSDPSKRILFGQSLGGQFAIYAASIAPNLFWGHIASNPALHRNLDFFLKEENFDSNKNNATPILLVTSGENDHPRFRTPALEWMEYWGKKDDAPWLLKTATLKGHSHFSAAPEAFRLGLKWMFPTSE